MKRLLALLFLAPVASGATRGMVFSSNGDPLANVRVTIQRPAEPSIAEIERPPLATATTADDGSFTIDSNASGVLELRAARDGYAPAFLRILSSETDLAIELAPATSIKGRVNAGRAFVIASQGEGIVWWTRADEQGAFTIADPRGWCSALTIVHPDYAPHSIEISPSRPSLDITLTAGMNAAGTVVDANGRPVKNARVTAGRWRETTTAEDGTFTLRHIPSAVTRLVATDGAMHGTAPRRDKEVAIRIEPMHSVTGSVRDADKRPLAGVTVTAYDTTSSSGERHTAFTDDRGNYRIEHCTAADHMVFATAAGGLELAPEKAKLRNASTARVDLTAKASTYLAGIVIDERKRPVAGATVVYAIPQMPVAYAFVSHDEMASTRTGADGRFKIQRPEMMDRFEFRLQALHRRYALALTDPLTADKTKGPITITLYDGIETNGVVVDAEGKPVSGAGVVAVQDPFGAAVLPMDSVLSSRSMQPFVTTDAEGRFTLHLNATQHDLGVWKEGYAGYRQGDVFPRSGAEPLRIVLDKGVEIRGRVTRKGWTKPFTGTVLARGEDASFGMAPVREDGTFALQSLRPVAYTVQYSGESERGAAEKQVTAPATDVVIELPAVGEIRGRVVDKTTGEVLTQYLVVASPDRSTHRIENEETFTIQLAPGVVEISVRADGYMPEAREVNVEAGNTTAVTLSVARGRVATGRVIAENGAPIAEASVSIETDDAVPWIENQTDETGEFRIDGLPRERVTLDVKAPGFVPRTAQVEAGELDARVDVVLSRGRSARGRVVTSDGAPVDGATVWTYSGQMQQTTTGPDGTFTVEGIEDDRITVSASRDGVGTAQVTDAEISKEIVITIERVTEWGSIHGKVKGFVEGGWMYGVVDLSGPHSASAPIGRDGKYRIERVPAGEAEIRAIAMSMRGNASTAARSISIAPNGDTEIDLEFRTDLVIRGTVLEGGTPAVGRRVTFNSDAGHWSTTSGEGGAYEVTAIEPGSYTVTVDSGRTTFETRYNVTTSSTFDIRIERSEIQGRVIDEQGVPLAGVKIDVASAETTQSIAQDMTDASGAFALQVFRGAHILTATKKELATVVQRIEPDAVPLILRMTRSDGLRVRLVDARNGGTLGGYVVATDAAGMNIARVHDAQQDGSILVPLSAGSYRVSVSADGFATQSTRATVPLQGELRIALTPGGTLIVNSENPSTDLVKLVMPNGEEYVRCECNGIAEIRLGGKTTRIEHVAPGQYTMQVLDERERVKTSYPITIAEGQTTTAAIP